MENFFVFEAGATKTAMMYLKDGEKHEMTLPGFNPNIDNPAFQEAVKSVLQSVENAEVMFYGSGLATGDNKEVVKKIFEPYSPQKLQVFDDIIGAARAAFKTGPGVICIMGTGGLAAYYNGREIEKRRGGYGYLIDDLGGGHELGKRIVTSWLNEDFSEEVRDNLIKKTGMQAREFIAKVYASKDLGLISGLVLVAAELKELPGIDKLIREYFQDFLSKDVLPLSKEFELSSFSVVGSVGTGFYSQLRNTAKEMDLQLDQCIQNPIQRLFEYHLR